MADQVLSRTLNQKFDTVFEEVTHQESLNLLNRNDLKLFCLDIETNQFNYGPLVEFLEDNLGMYVFSRAGLDDLMEAGKDRTVALKAVRKLIKTGKPGEKGTGSELGEILDYCFFEHVLEAPKILSKYEQVTAGGRTFVLTHSGLDRFSPEKELKDYGLEDFLFCRPHLDSAYYPDKLLIFGHTPTRTLCGENRILRRETWLDIDCGCVFKGGRLGCLCLDTLEEFYV